MVAPILAYDFGKLDETLDVTLLSGVDCISIHNKIRKTYK